MQELGYALAWGNEYLTQLTESGVDATEAAKRIKFNMGIGIKGDCLVLYASKDGTSDAKTPEKLRDYMFAKGVTNFVMGSCVCADFRSFYSKTAA